MKARRPSFAFDYITLGTEGFRIVAALYAQAFDEPWPEPSVRELLSIPGTWALVARDPTGEPAGFLLMRVILDEAEVLALGVPPDLRRRGIAEGLLAAGLARARKAGAVSVFLEVGEDNPAALALYGKAGFEAHGRRKGYYRRANGASVDACLLRRDYCDTQNETDL